MTGYVIENLGTFIYHENIFFKSGKCEKEKPLNFKKRGGKSNRIEWRIL